jgi:hypothetical protein
VWNETDSVGGRSGHQRCGIGGMCTLLLAIDEGGGGASSPEHVAERRVGRVRGLNRRRCWWACCGGVDAEDAGAALDVVAALGRARKLIERNRDCLGVSLEGES